MSVNTAHANGGVLIFNGEIIILYSDGVELSIEGINAKEFSGTKKGRIYLTTHRMIFLNKSEKDPLQSFSFPFFSMANLELEQPVFGANYIKGVVNAQTGGNFSGKATFKLKFFSGGAIEFGQSMLRAAQMARPYMSPQPPPYTPYAGPYYPAPPPAYQAPDGGINGFVPPTHVFPNAPPANSVFQTEMPPPYPGIYPPPQYYPQPPNAPNGYASQPMANGPPPPGFAPTPGNYNLPPGYAPPGYSSGPAQGASGAPEQYNGSFSQAPPSETKSGIPVHTFYDNPHGQGPFALYNGNAPNPSGPPPPYPFNEDAKKQQ